MHAGIQLGGIDYVILVVYFLFVLGIGWALKRYTKTSEDFFLSGRSIPAWIAGLAFLSANLGAQEMIGMAASGAKYGIATAHFYWVGAIPAMVFVGIFMMPFYYGSKARSVPEYLKLRFDEKTRGLQRDLLRHHDRLLLGHLDVRAREAARAAARLGLQLLALGLGDHRARLHLPGRPHLGDLQRGAAVLPDRARLRAARVPGPARRGRLGGPHREAEHGGHREPATPPARGASPGATCRAPPRTRWASSGSGW